MNLSTSKTLNAPPQAYLYFPEAHDMKTSHGDRLIFDGNTQFDDHENMKITEFRNYANSHHYTLSPSIWTNSMILRFLYASGFRNDKTLESIKEHTHWREKSLPVNVDTKLSQYLNSGIIYVSGRDNKFRPIVVFNVNLIDSKTFDYHLITRYLTFWFEFIIQDLMLPGQIENWVFIVNLKSMKVSKSTTHSLKQVFSFLQENYKCRLHSLYMVNASSSIYLPWKVIQKFLDEVTVNKINFYKSSTPDALFMHANSEQIENQFGGSAPNATRHWPPQPTSNNFFISKEDERSLVSVETYNSLFKQGRLQNMKINQSFIKEDVVAVEPEKYNETTFDTATSSVNLMANRNIEVVDEQVKLEKSLPVLKKDDSYLSFTDYSEQPGDDGNYDEFMNEAVARSQYIIRKDVNPILPKTNLSVNQHDLC